MKVIIKSFLIAIAICAGGFGLSLLLAGCATTAGGIAIAGGEKAAGDVFANALLNKVDSSSAGLTAQKTAVADLNQVGVDLKAFAAGTLNISSGTLAQTTHSITAPALTITGGVISRSTGTFDSGVVTADGTNLTFGQNSSTPATISSW